MPKTHAETVKEDKPTEIPETVETPPESVTEPPKAEFDVNYWISFARSYALQIGLEIDPTAVDCWDNPTTANADCIYLERDLTHRLDRYNRDDDITAVNIWAESLGNENYLISWLSPPFAYMVAKSERKHQCAKIGFADLTGKVSYEYIRLSRNREGLTLHLFTLRNPNRTPISEKYF